MSVRIIESFSFLIGTHDFDPGDATHFDVSYAYNDNLSFTLSILDQDGADPEPTFVASYSIAIE